MDKVHKHSTGSFTCPGCSRAFSEFGSIGAITPRSLAESGYVFFECAECTQHAASMSKEQRTWALEKIAKKLARNPDAYSAIKTADGAAALQIVQDFHASGIETRNTLAALAAGMTGPARRAEAARQAKADADRDDAAWFSENPHRCYRLRPVLGAELDGLDVGYPPEAVLVIQVEAGKRSRAVLPPGGLAWPNDNDFLEGALLAATEAPMPLGVGPKMTGWQAWNGLMGSPSGA